MIRVSSKPPKFISDLFSVFRKWKLGRYKQKKVRKEKTFRDRLYFVKFSIKIEDEINPKELKEKYQMIIPAKAAFFAKRRARKAMIKKMEFSFFDCEEMTDDELESFEKSKDKYIAKKTKV
ncbi:MAG: hypothetical protein AABY15_01880 [Nanoarchaeota archaeon]